MYVRVETSEATVFKIRLARRQFSLSFISRTKFCSKEAKVYERKAKRSYVVETSSNKRKYLGRDILNTKHFEREETRNT